MIIAWDLGLNELRYNGKTIRCTCKVRNELNGRRNKNEVVYSIPGKKPYQPRIFPAGVWKVERPVEREDPYLAPYFIPTNAKQYVDIWLLDPDGRYDKPSGAMELDRGYGLHYSASSTTLGCGRIDSRVDLLDLVKAINAALDDGEEVTLHVN